MVKRKRRKLEQKQNNINQLEAMFTLIKTRKNNEQKTEKQKETRKKKKKPKEKENTEDKKKIFFLNVRFKVFLCCHWFTMWAESRSMSVNLNKPAAAPLG